MSKMARGGRSLWGRLRVRYKILFVIKVAGQAASLILYNLSSEDKSGLEVHTW